MKVHFRTKKLQKQYENEKEAQKTYGEEVARKYIQRINIIQSVDNFQELKDLPGLNCHPLKGDRQGEWAIKLNRFYRLIFTLQDDTLEVVIIEEVSKHYGD